MERYSWWWLLIDVMEALRWPWRMMMLCYLDWWHGGFALLMTWSFGWWRLGLDDVLVDGGFWWWLGWWSFWFVDDLEIVLFYTLPISWSLPPLRVGSLKPLLVGSKRTLAGSSERVGTLISVGAERSPKIEVFHMATSQIVSDGFYQWIMIEFSIYIWCTLSTCLGLELIMTRIDDVASWYDD